jgi:hypothetical protein
MAMKSTTTILKFSLYCWVLVWFCYFFLLPAFAIGNYWIVPYGFLIVEVIYLLATGVLFFG